MPYKDPARRKAYSRDYQSRRLQEPEFHAAHMTRVRATKARKVAADKALIAEFRSGGCAYCGEKEVACLAAHHRDPALKEFDIGSRRCRDASPGRVRDELAKCDCVCHNCHAKIHAGVITTGR